MPVSYRFCFFTFFAVSIFSFAGSSVSAQTAGDGASASAVIQSDDGTKTIYPASFFAPYSPLSLTDMLQRIPGVSVGGSISTDERRGLRGNEDAILINGQQVTGKDSGGSTALANIAANQVDRIEILHGSSAEVQSTTQRIINVILLNDGGETFSFTVAAPLYPGDGSVRPVLGLIYAVNAIDRNYTIALNTMPQYRPWKRTKVTSDLLGNVLLSSVESEQKDTYSGNITGRYEQEFPGGSRLQLNALAQWNNNDRERREVIRDPNLPTGSDQLVDLLEDDDRDRSTTELSADFSFPLGSKSTFTVLGLYNWEEENKHRDVFDLAPLDEPVLAHEDRLDTKTESIVRGIYDRTFSPTVGFQIGLEGTLNTQKTDFDLATRVNGMLQPLPIFNSDGKVTEYRGEGFATLRWRPWDTVETEFGLAVEASRITQKSSDVDSARSLVFAKPTFSIYWDVTRRNKVFLSIKRDVD